MHLEPRTVDIGRNGSVSAVVGYPPRFRPGEVTAVILAHGAGNDMNNPLLSGVHRGLAAAGFVAVKFNFPFKERGSRLPDRAPVLEDCYRRMVDAIRDDSAIRPRALILGGKSLGGRMASHLAAQGTECDGLLFLGYPLHPPGRSDQLRAAHLPSIRVPMLFFAGTRDTLCDLELLRRELGKLHTPCALHVVEGGDHSFKLPKRLGRTEDQVVGEIVGASAAWLAAL